MIHVHYGCSNEFTDTLTKHNVDWTSCVPEDVDAHVDEVIIPVSIDKATGFFEFPDHANWAQDEEIYFCFIDESRGIICNNYHCTLDEGVYKCDDYLTTEDLFDAAKEDNEEANSTEKVESTGTTLSTGSTRRRRRG